MYTSTSRYMFVYTYAYLYFEEETRMSFTAAFQAFYIENSSRSDFKEKPRQAQKREIKTKKFLLYRVPPSKERHITGLWSIYAKDGPSSKQSIF